MKYAYHWMWPLLAALFSFIALSSSAQQAFRPFRPGLIYSYRAPSATTNNLIYTLRVDSAYATAGGDSVYAFNRILRNTSPVGGLVKSRDNLFGTLLRWHPGQTSYTLEALAQPNVQAAVSLELFPQAAIGSTWNASTQPLRTATLVSRSLQTISPGVQDMVAVININSSGVITTFRLGQDYGLLAGPQWLGGTTGNQLEQALLPARFEESLYNPLQFFDVQPGDEFGYQEYDMGVSQIRCYDNKMLRRILSKRLTADSLIITYQEQSRYENFGYNGPCSPAPAQVTYSPITVKRWLLARRGNQWQTNGAIDQFAALRLLTGEYISIGPGAASYVLTGLPIDNSGANTCPATLRTLISYGPYYLRSGTTPPTYAPGVDYAAWQYGFGQGLTTTVEGLSFMVMIYYRKSVNGTTQICGSPLAFVNMLPARAAQAATLATLHPNPAAEAATLTFAAPARIGSTLRLTDVLGRLVWSAPVPTGQTAISVSLAGQPAGLYLLHLSNTDGTSASWKLVHE